MNNNEKNKFLGMLYDILVTNNIKKYDEKPKDIKEKINRLNEYLVKLKRVQDRAMDNERYLDRIKYLYYDRYVIKEENISDGYLHFLEKQYLEQGHGHINLVNPQNEKEQKLRQEHIKTIIKEQKDSLDNWLNYFLSKDSEYLPMWAKVWAFQGMLQIGNLNKDKDGYDKRSKTTTNPFVSFDSEILGRCVTLIEESFEKKEMTEEEVKKLVESGTFSKLYGKLLANKKQVKTETTDGIWIKYNRETVESIENKIEQGIEPEHIKLYNSLQGYNTGWCTAGSRETAKEQLLGGDFYVYYSLDKNGEYKIPRLAIRMEEDEIGEIRGISSNQNIESNMEKILEEKLKEFPDAEKYKKKVSDMKRLTEIYNKNLNKEELSKEELRFLYEIAEKITGFGYEADPRIKEILETRNEKKDLTYIFDCDEEQIILDGDYNKLKSSPKPIKYYKGYLNLSRLTSAEGLKLPKVVNGSLDLSSLTSIEDLVLPETVNGALWLDSLTSAEGLVLPKTLNGRIILSGLKSAEGLVFPETLNGDLYLHSLTSAEGLVLPQTINGWLVLRGLTNAEGLVLPKTLNGYLNLGGLTNAEGLVLPKTLNGYLNLGGLTNAEGLVLPETINGSLNLSGLTSLEGIVLPNMVKDRISIYNGDYTLEEVKEMQQRELANKKNSELKGTRRSSSGIVSISFLIASILMFCSLTFFVCNMILNK